jgi:hypothetical protein
VRMETGSPIAQSMEKQVDLRLYSIWSDDESRLARSDPTSS